MKYDFNDVIQQVKQCTLCQPYLPQPAKPVFQLNPAAKILIAGQAPGRLAHDSGQPFTDASGQRLRQWLGIAEDVFYDPLKVAILPMAFCYPGKGRTGDLPPRPECAATWREKLLALLPQVQLTLVIGQYAQQYHFGSDGLSLTERVKRWRQSPAMLPLPHPSPRNRYWFQQNPWFNSELLPVLQQQIKAILCEK